MNISAPFIRRPVATTLACRSHRHGGGCSFPIATRGAAAGDGLPDDCRGCRFAGFVTARLYGVVGVATPLDRPVQANRRRHGNDLDKLSGDERDRVAV